MRTLKINLLYRCTAKCAHCRFSCENESALVKPDFGTPVAVAERLKKSFGLDMAVVLGGEPTLFAGDTLEMLGRLNALGLRTRLETNGSWAGTPESAAGFLKPLKEFHTSVMLSLDGFHDPFVPVEYIANAVNACLGLGVDCNLELPYLDVRRRDHPVDRRTKELHSRLRAMTAAEIPVYEGNVIFTGRAARRYGDEFAAGKGVPAGACTAVPWWSDGGIATTELLILEPGGYLTKGCGIAIGNVFERDAADMLRSYRAEEHPIFSVLIGKGPLGLAGMAARYGYTLKKDYADKCHLCHEARLALQPHYPDVLQPMQHYAAD